MSDLYELPEPDMVKGVPQPPLPFEAQLVYVAGPYSTGNPDFNASAAISVGNQLADAGHYPLIPHLSHFWNAQHPRPYEWWLEYDFRLLKTCDVLIRMPGFSPGAEREETQAMRYGIPTIAGATLDHVLSVFFFRYGRCKHGK